MFPIYPIPLFCAFVLLLLTSISLPFFSAMDIVRVQSNVSGFGSNINVGEIRFGIWTSCEYSSIDNSHSCSPSGPGYTTLLVSLTNFNIVTIGSSWTRGLVATVFAGGVTLIAFAFSLTRHKVIACFLSVAAAAISFITFAIDIALLAYVKGQIGSLKGSDGGIFSATTSGGPGFWMTFVSFLILLGTGGAMGLSVRRRVAGESYRMNSAARVKAMMAEDAGK